MKRFKTFLRFLYRIVTLERFKALKNELYTLKIDLEYPDLTFYEWSKQFQFWNGRYWKNVKELYEFIKYMQQ